MKKNLKNEELQSRREFFKKAAKGVLPILSAVVLASNPLVSQAAQEQMGCSWGCTTSCYGSCSSHCGMGCSGGCAGSCGGCRGACMSSCTGHVY